MSSKKRLIIDGEVLVMPHFSGIGHYTFELLRAIDRQLDTHHSFEVSLLIHFRHVEKAKSFGFRNIEIIPSPFSLRISNGLKTRNKQPPLDLLFGRGVYLFPNFTSWPLLFSKSVPIIYDLSYELYPQYAEPRNQAFLSEGVKVATKRASLIVTISENSKREICEFYHFPEKNICVINPAVDTTKYYRRPAIEVDKVCRKYGITGKYILFVGNIEPRKNLKNLLLAYEKLPSKVRSEYGLTLVGAKGWQDEEIFSIIERMRAKGDTIQLPTKYVTDVDMPAIYSGASLFVYPSIYEGFGIPPIEAMACEVPVITSDNSSLPEVVGAAGELVDAESINVLATTISRVLGDDARKKDMVLRGLKQIESFNWDASAKKLISAIFN